jgi:broad specificity phosphatase PhoE
MLYLVRHGQTRLNAEDRLRGHADEPLDELGQEQAHALADLFRDVAICGVVTSPLRRASQTAAAIAAMSGTRLDVDERFIDRDYGPWTGSPRAQIETSFAGLDRAPDVEPASALISRVVLGARDLLQLETDPIVLVAHDAVNRAILASLCHNTPQDPSAIPQRTGCWNQIERDEQSYRAVVVDACPGDGQKP